METAKQILDKHIEKYYTKEPLIWFEDLPDIVFIEAMQEYADQPTRIDWDEILERLKTFCYTQHDDTPSIGGKCIDYLKSKLS